MTWQKLTPLEHPGYRSNCLTCGPQPIQLSLGAVLAVGFGAVTVTKDDETVWSGDDDRVTLRRFERQASKDPDHDWRVTFMGPLSEPEYQRQDGKWLLVRKGEGFA
jgi:hypothetical protein